MVWVVDQGTDGSSVTNQAKSAVFLHFERVLAFRCFPSKISALNSLFVMHRWYRGAVKEGIAAVVEQPGNTSGC